MSLISGIHFSMTKFRKSILIMGFIILLSVQISAVGMKGERYATEGFDYYSRGDYQNAEQQFILANQAADHSEPDYLFWLGKIQIALAKPDKALEYLKQYTEINKGAYQKEATSIIDILEHQKLIFEEISLHRLPHYVNSRNSDFAPYVTSDGKFMYFTSLRPADNDKENIWRVERLANTWGKPMLQESFNTDKNESFGSLSLDGSTAYLFGNYDKGKVDGDIYESKNTGVWSKPTPIDAINSDQIDLQPYIAQDKYLFFSSSRDGGLGGTDLYVSEKIGDKWQTPINLGSRVNTSQNEQSPFLDWDGKTLYFASDGLDGLGGYDMFKVVKIGPNWTDWSLPENLGLPANSVMNDRCFFRTRNSNEAFFSSDRDNTGFENIYTLLLKLAPREYVVTNDTTGTKKVVKDVTETKTIKEPVKPKTFITIKGTVLDENEQPQVAEIHIQYKDGDNLIKKITYSGADGRFGIMLPTSDAYDYTINKEGYFLESGTLTPGKDQKELTTLIKMRKMEVKKVFVFNNIQFKFNSSYITEDSYPVLDEIAVTLINNSNLKVEVSGHTCNIGPADYNLWLSERRAASVAKYLVGKGVVEDHLVVKGYGITKPIADNNTVEGRRLNRRTEIKVLE